MGSNHHDPDAHIDAAGVAIAPQNIDGSADVAGESVDRLDEGNPQFYLFSATIAETSANDEINFVLEESGDGSNWDAVEGHELTLEDGGDEFGTIKVNGRGRARYLRLFADDANITAATNFDVAAFYVGGAAKESNSL